LGGSECIGIEIERGKKSDLEKIEIRSIRSSIFADAESSMINSMKNRS
jgi:hypothetical protein